jgi:hypothetical protein
MSNFGFRPSGSRVDRAGAIYHNHEGLIPTYSVTAHGVTPAASATDVVILSSSASRLVKVRRVIIGGAATSASATVFHFVRRSTAATGGTATTPTPVRRDTSDQAATAVLQQFSANPSAVGTDIGLLLTFRYNLGALATPNPPAPLVFGDVTDEPIVLRPGEFMAISNAGAAIPGGMIFDYTVIWTEE